MTGQGADELRVRAFLRALHARPFGHQEPAMPHDDRPITPTRVIPAGAELPARLPEPGEAPPWRTPPPPPPVRPADPPSEPWPAAPPPGPIEVRVHVDLAPPAEPEPEPEESRWSRTWAAVTARVSPWKAALALFAAVVPIPFTGYSAAVTWHYTVTEARALHVGFGYGLAFGAFLLAANRLRQRGGVICLFLCATTLIGLFGAMSWYDPIHWLTGVPR
jgi:hypothetical protein